ncbi:sulfotransferase domain-containing protein [Bacteroidota bacterium]
MNDNSNKEIFFHVGLGKTATTFLQYKVFPKFKGVYYIQRTKYKKSIQIIQKTNYDKYFVSNEFDRQFEREVTNFAKYYPDAKIIIVLRRHDSWIASQYRRFVKNGFDKPFEQFIDIDNDKGKWKQRDLYYFSKLQMIQELFSVKPLVLFYDELKKEPMSFIDRIVKYMNVTFDETDISLTRKHISYNEKQLKVRRSVNKYFHGHVKESKNSFIKLLQRLFIIMPTRYIILYFALLVPNRFVKKEPLTSKEYLDKIRNYFDDDWNKCLDFAEKL